MNKLLINLTACAFGLALSSTVFAADQMSPEKDTTSQAAQSDTNPAPDDKTGGMTADRSTDKSTQKDPQAAPNSKPASVAADKANKPEESSPAYVAALKKCEALNGTEKATCEKKAKKDSAKM